MSAPATKKHVDKLVSLPESHYHFHLPAQCQQQPQPPLNLLQARIACRNQLAEQIAQLNEQCFSSISLNYVLEHDHKHQQQHPYGAGADSCSQPGTVIIKFERYTPVRQFHGFWPMLDSTRFFQVLAASQQHEKNGIPNDTPNDTSQPQSRTSRRPCVYEERYTTSAKIEITAGEFSSSSTSTGNCASAAAPAPSSSLSPSASSSASSSASPSPFPSSCREFLRVRVVFDNELLPYLTLPLLQPIISKYNYKQNDNDCDNDNDHEITSSTSQSQSTQSNTTNGNAKQWNQSTPHCISFWGWPYVRSADMPFRTEYEIVHYLDDQGRPVSDAKPDIDVATVALIQRIPP